MVNIKIFIIILFFIDMIQINSQIIIPFKNNLNFQSLTTENFISQLSNLNITTKISLGNPLIEIPFNIKLSSYHMICLSYNSNKGKIFPSFNEEKSSSFSSKDKKAQFYHLYDTEFCRRSNENFKINNIEIKNISFFLSYDLERNQSGVLGLKLSDSFSEYNFINQLKMNDLISSQTMFFKFKNLNEGDLIIGNYPHEINNKIYNENNYKKTQVPISSLNQEYSMIINKVKYGDEIIVENQEFIFNINNFFTLANLDLLKIMKEKVLNELLENKKCEEKIQKSSIQETFYYVCDKGINIKNIENIKFISNDLKYEFIFNPNDLFIQENGKMFLIIYFMNYWQKKWIFGYHFLTKFQIIFNQDKKTIGFYSKINEIQLPISLIVSIIFALIIIILVLYIFRLLKKKRKIKANELVENFEYISQ